MLQESDTHKKYIRKILEDEKQNLVESRLEYHTDSNNSLRILELCDFKFVESSTFI